jgi:hypothetical protein
MRTAAVIGVIGFMLLLLPTTGAQAQVWSGNDGGGIIPWSCQIEPYAMRIAAQHCAQFHKYPRVTGVQRHPGDFISFACLWTPYVETYARPAVPLYGGCTPGPGYYKAASAASAAAPVAAASAPPAAAPLAASASALPAPEPEAASAPLAPPSRRQSPKSN